MSFFGKFDMLKVAGQHSAKSRVLDLGDEVVFLSNFFLGPGINLLFAQDHGHVDGLGS